jgi:NADH dehydrogenase FAD-containing subunit
LRLVLLGSGSGHLNFIRDKVRGLHPEVEVILVSPASQVFYKPAFNTVLWNQKSVHDAIIDLRKISTLSGVTFIQSNIESVDTEQKLIKFTDRASLQFDFLSIEGIDVPKSAGTVSHGAPTRQEKHPEYVFQVHDFIHFFQQLKDLEAALVEHRHYPYHIGVIGAGRTGVQLALGLSERFKKFSSKISWEVLEAQDIILPDYHLQIRKRMEKELRSKDILFHTQFKVDQIEEHILRNARNSKKFFDADLIFLASGTELPAWLENSDLPLTAEGYLDAHNNLTLKTLPNVVASGAAAGRRASKAEIATHGLALEKIAAGQSLESKKAKPIKKIGKITTMYTDKKALQVNWGLLSEKEKPFVEFQATLNLQLDHLRGIKEQKLAQLLPQVEENIFVEKFKKRLLLDMTVEQLEVIFSEKLGDRFSIDFWCEREYRDVFNDHYLSSYHTGLDILDQAYARGGVPKYLRLYVSAPSSIRDVEVLSQILIGAFRACKDAVELHVHLCGQAMNTVQFSLGMEVSGETGLVPSPVAFIALTRPLGLYGLLSQQGKEGWEGQWLSDIWTQLTTGQKILAGMLEKKRRHLAIFQLSENGFINDIVKAVGSEGSRICLNLSTLPRWDGVDQILKRKPTDVLLQKNWKKGFRYWSGQGENIPESQYLLWEPHLIRPPTCLLVDPAYARELSQEYKEKYRQKLVFIGYVEKTQAAIQTQYTLSDWSFETRGESPEADDTAMFEQLSVELIGDGLPDGGVLL